MTTPTNKPSSAELRERADYRRQQWIAGETGPDHELWACLYAGADAMDSLAAMQAQRDRLAEALRGLVQAIDDDEGEIGPCTAELASCTQTARAALAELEGGAS